MTTLADQLQRFHAAVTGAAPLETVRELVEEGAIPASTRLGVYAHAYTARIAGVLAFDYPKLDALLGSVRDLTPAYLRAHPPAHPSLREVGQPLGRFLADRGDPVHLVELAQLERARTEVFDGPDARTLARADLAELGVEGFPTLRLQLVPASRVVELSTSADELWDALEARQAPPPPSARPCTVLVWRRDVTVIHRTLDPDEARVVRQLARGISFADACELLADDPSPAERALALLVHWLDTAILRTER